MNVLFEDGLLRPFLRFFVSLFGILIVVICVSFVAFSMPPPFRGLPRGLTLLFWFNLLLLPVLLGLYMLLSRLLEHRPLASVGLAFHPRWNNELLLGLIAGAVMILAVAGTERLLGFATFTLTPTRTVTLTGAFPLLLFAVAAANEELMFRGYPFQRLIDVGGPVFAVVILSALFGFAHIRNPFHTWISTLNTMVVGALLAICYLRTRALWLPLGIHFAWNFVQGCVLGFPVSGIRFPAPLLQAKTSGPIWLTGGAYGPESSILTLGIFIVGAVYFFATNRITVTREMRDLALGPRGGKESQTALIFRDLFPTERR